MCMSGGTDPDGQLTNMLLASIAQPANDAESFLSWLLLVLRPLFFIFMLVLIMSMLAWPYAELRLGAK